VSTARSRGDRLARFALRDKPEVAAAPSGPLPPPLQAPQGDSQALPELASAGFYQGQITREIFFPGQQAKSGLPGHPLAPPLERYLTDQGITLFSHQAELFDLVRSGQHAVLATPTASGKTLGFLLPTFDKLLRSKDATALYLYPTKALAYDQLARIKDFDDRVNCQARPAVYDGDTPSRERKQIRSSSRLIITNPHGLNLYLGWHASWASFLRNLAVVVVDEAHAYSGDLGASVSLVLWRLRRLLAYYGASPTFLSASGTIANPRDHVEELTRHPTVLVDKDGSAQPDRWICVWDATKEGEIAPATQAAYLARHLMRAKRQVAVFSQTRAQAEYVATLGTDHANRLIPYRAGYAPEVRRQLEADLRTGRVRGVSATSALELGVDIGTLDTVILNGYPGSIASLWQRIGRAGRSGQKAIGVLVMGGDPLSRSVVANIDDILARPPERAVCNTGQLGVMGRHLVLAAAELPLFVDELVGLEASAPERARELSKQGRLIKQCDHWLSTTRLPHRQTPLIEREESYQISFAREKGRHLAPESISTSQALREAYPGAIYTHLGQRFRVGAWGPGKIIPARREPLLHRTVPSSFRTVTRLGLQRAWSHQGVADLQLYQALIVDQVTGFRELDADGSQIKKRPLSLGSRTVRGEALVIEPVDLAYLGVQTGYAALHGLEHVIARVLPLLSLSAPHDLLAQTLRGDGKPSIVLSQAGSGGFLGSAAQDFPRVLELAAGVIEACVCVQGCPLCIRDARCEDFEIDKDSAGVLSRQWAKVGPVIRQS